MQAGTNDKTPCCYFDSSCGVDPRYGCCFRVLPPDLLCGSEDCPANTCPGVIYSKTVNVVDFQFHQCAPGSTSTSILPQRLAVGSREENKPFCGSYCDNGDDFTGFGFAFAFGYTAAWTCDGQNHAVSDCTMTANSACGNGVCELVGNEHPYNCPEDCEACDPETNPNCEE